MASSQPTEPAMADAQPPAPPPAARFNLVVPRSACPKCSARITAIQNIPVISYLFLRGKCANCGVRISPRYPLVEMTTAILSAVVAVKLGMNAWTLAALALTWCLVALSMIDFDHQLLPDQITLPLVWVGLLLSLYVTPGSPFAPDMKSSIIGGVAGYLSLWSVYWLFKLLTGKEGMGYGDFKLLAVIGIGLIVLRGRDRNIPIPYGPYLAIAGWIVMLWGDTLIGAYLTTVGLK